jgi:hypothetical protein
MTDLRMRNNRFHRNAIATEALLMIIGLALPLAGGCGQRTTVPMSGAVTLDDQPLKIGIITLTPIEGTAAPSTGAAIQDGRYSITADKGPKLGVNYRVEISSIDRTNLAPTDIAKDAIPAQYNSGSTLQVFVPNDARRVEQDFPLTTSKARKR